MLGVGPPTYRAVQSAPAEGAEGAERRNLCPPFREMAPMTSQRLERKFKPNQRVFVYFSVEAIYFPIENAPNVCVSFDRECKCIWVFVYRVQRRGDCAISVSLPSSFL